MSARRFESRDRGFLRELELRARAGTTPRLVMQGGYFFCAFCGAAEGNPHFGEQRSATGNLLRSACPAQGQIVAELAIERRAQLVAAQPLPERLRSIARMLERSGGFDGGAPVESSPRAVAVAAARVTAAQLLDDASAELARIVGGSR